MQELIELVSNTGFPIFVALYFMFKLEKTIKDNTAVLNELKILIKTYAR